MILKIRYMGISHSLAPDNHYLFLEVGESYGYGNEMPVDCFKLPNSMVKGFGLGCPGAVDDEGNSSEELCMTETWWKNCCKWAGGKCISKVTITDLIVSTYLYGL